MGTTTLTLYHAAFITAAALGCIITSFIYTSFRQQRKYAAIQRKYFTLLVDALEKEKKRLSMDLHDDLGPLISITRSHADMLVAQNEEQLFHISKIKYYTEMFIKHLRQIAGNLSPYALERKGLFVALERFFKIIEEGSPLQIHFRHDVTSKLSASSSLHLYRIVQEIANNTVKHSGANKLSVHFKEYKEILYLHCKDDGKGFRKETIAKTGAGLQNIESRSRLLGGQMKIVSVPNNGTEYFFQFSQYQNYDQTNDCRRPTPDQGADDGTTR